MGRLLPLAKLIQLVDLFEIVKDLARLGRVDATNGYSDVDKEIVANLGLGNRAEVDLPDDPAKTDPTGSEEIHSFNLIQFTQLNQLTGNRQTHIACLLLSSSSRRFDHLDRDRFAMPAEPLAIRA